MLHQQLSIRANQRSILQQTRQKYNFSFYHNKIQPRQIDEKYVISFKFSSLDEQLKSFFAKKLEKHQVVYFHKQKSFSLVMILIEFETYKFSDYQSLMSEYQSDDIKIQTISKSTFYQYKAQILDTVFRLKKSVYDRLLNQKKTLKIAPLKNFYQQAQSLTSQNAKFGKPSQYFQFGMKRPQESKSLNSHGFKHQHYQNPNILTSQNVKFTKKSPQTSKSLTSENFKLEPKKSQNESTFTFQSIKLIQAIPSKKRTSQFPQKQHR